MGDGRSGNGLLGATNWAKLGFFGGQAFATGNAIHVNYLPDLVVCEYDYTVAWLKDNFLGAIWI